MVKRTKTKQARKAQKKQPRMRSYAAARSSNEVRLLRLITDPCSAPLTTGYNLATEGLVQRFNKFITPAAAAENAFAYIFRPHNQIDTAIVQKLATGTGAASNVTTTGPGATFLDTNADAVAIVGACMEVLYTGKLVDRKGYIGVCQATSFVMDEIASGTTDLPTLLSYCQAIQPVGSEAVSVKFAPTIRDVTAQQTSSETSATGGSTLMVVAIGVNPNDFVIKFTSVVEYIPKFALGMPAPRATKAIAPGAPERLVSTLDSMGHWWHNVGDAAAAAYRLGGRMVYGAGQVARLAGGAVNTVRALQSAAVPLLALTG